MYGMNTCDLHGLMHGGVQAGNGALVGTQKKKKKNQSRHTLTVAAHIDFFNFH